MKLPNFQRRKPQQPKIEVPAPPKQPIDDKKHIYIEYTDKDLPDTIKMRTVTEGFFNLLRKSTPTDPQLRAFEIDAPGERQDDPLIHIMAIITDRDLSGERTNEIAQIVWRKCIEGGLIAE